MDNNQQQQQAPAAATNGSKICGSNGIPPTATDDELPLTPQSNNRAPALSMLDVVGDVVVNDSHIIEGVVAAVPSLLNDEEIMDEDEMGVGVEVVRAMSPVRASTQQPATAASTITEEMAHQESNNKNYQRNMSALSVSTAEERVEGGSAQTSFSLDEEEEQLLMLSQLTGVHEGLAGTPKSSLVSTNDKKQQLEAGGTPTTSNSNNEAETAAGGGIPGAAATSQAQAGLLGAASKAVDWIPQQTTTKHQNENSLSGVTSQAVRLGDDVTETSFTTMTTVGGGERPLPPPPPKPSSSRAAAAAIAAGRTTLRVAAAGSAQHVPTTTTTTGRSPRPPRHLRAVDWCPPGGGDAAANNTTNNYYRHHHGSSTNAASAGAGGGSSSSASANAVNNLASDKTATTSRAVRLGDDNTVTTFATMTTMGDAGSILEADTEDEASSTSDGGGNNKGGGEDMEGVKEEDQEEVASMMEDVKDDNGAAVVDKIPAYRASRIGGGSMSGTTNHAVPRAADDQSVVTFATMTTVGGMDRGGIQQQDVVDKVPSFPPPRSSTSIVTNETVQMGDNQSLATWATTNTMGGQLTGNVVDHVPHQKTNNDDEGGEEEEEEEESSNITVGTSNAVKEDPTVTTFATSATNNSAINEVVDKIPTFAGGHPPAGRSSVMSGVTNNAVRMSGTNTSMGMGVAGAGFVPDDRSVASFATMTTMGDLGSIFETEVYEDDNNDDDDDDNDGDANDSTLRPRLFSYNTYPEINRTVVDVIPEAASSVASGTTNHSIRTDGGLDVDGDSVTTFGTLTTAGRGDHHHHQEGVPSDGGRELEGEPSLGRGGERRSHNNAEGENGDVVDKVPTYPNARSIVSGTTNHAVRLNDDQSVATWATTATSGVLGHVNEHVVDKTPSFKETHAADGDDGGGGVGSSSSDAVSETDQTNHAVKDSEDQSVVTWNTMTTGISRPLARSPPPPPMTTQPYAVDRVPSFSNQRTAASLSGTTNYAVRPADDQSVVTFATMTTVGGMDRGGIEQDVVDKVPSFAAATPREDTTSFVTNETVQMGDNQSLATWATANTMGGQLTGNVVDHVPNQKNGRGEEVGGEEEEKSNITVGTSNAVKEDPSVTTFTTSAMSTSSAINEVVDKIPTFAGGGGGATGRSVTSGVTNQAVRMGGGGGADDRSLASFATMTTMGGNSVYENNTTNNLVDRIPDGTTASIVSGRTDNAVRLGDDLTITTFATMTTAGGGAEGGVGSERAGSDDQENDALSGSGTSSSRFMAPPTTGILRESRHRPSVLRDSREYRTSVSDSAAAAATANNFVEDLPINVGESVSNTHILRAIADLRFHVDYRMGEMRELNRRDSDRVLQIVQQEQAKRTALEARLHAQLLLQSESMVAMELKLLRLEAKAVNRDSRLQRRQPGMVGGTTTTITDRLSPIAATPSTPNHSDEEVDSFEELELTPRANRHSSLYNTHPGGGGMMHRGGMGPANIAVVTRSGASVASAVTATSFQEGDFSQAMNDEEGSDEDIGDDEDINDDGSTSTPTHGSRNRISNLESILLNPIQSSGSNDHGISTRAVRGDTDGMSSLPTTVTDATIASTVVTSTTRGGESVGITRIPSRASEEDALQEGAEGEDTNAGNLRATARSNSMSSDERVSHQPGEQHRAPRSRSQSPLSAASASVNQSVASASLGPSIGPSVLSTAAVASYRSFGTRRLNAAAAIAANADAGSSRSMANRVVSFTTNDLTAGAPSPPPQENDGGGDSITMPDELDNFSDIADAFSNSARVWREEYEARLDAINKRLGN